MPSLRDALPISRQGGRQAEEGGRKETLSPLGKDGLAHASLRHCERTEAIQGGLRNAGLPRGFAARNDGGSVTIWPTERLARPSLSTPPRPTVPTPSTRATGSSRRLFPPWSQPPRANTAAACPPNWPALSSTPTPTSPHPTTPHPP